MSPILLDFTGMKMSPLPQSFFIPVSDFYFSCLIHTYSMYINAHTKDHTHVWTHTLTHVYTPHSHTHLM